MNHPHTDTSAQANENKVNQWFFPVLTGVILMGTVFIMATTAAGLWDGNVHSKKGLEALGKGNLIQAIRQFSRAQQLCETDLFARYQLGASYQLYGWHDEALHEYEKVWNLSQDLGFRAMVGDSRIRQERGDLSGAARSLERALALAPDTATVWHDLGGIYLALENTGRAAECFTRAVKLQPENDQYRDALLSLALRQGNQPANDSGDATGGQE